MVNLYEKQMEKMILIKKWEQTGLLNDIPILKDKNFLAIFLENAYNKVLKDKKVDKDFNGYLFPLVRVVFEKTKTELDYEKAKEIFSKIKSDKESEKMKLLKQKYFEAMEKENESSRGSTG